MISLKLLLLRRPFTVHLSFFFKFKHFTFKVFHENRNHEPLFDFSFNSTSSNKCILERLLGRLREGLPRRHKAQHHDVAGVRLGVAEQRVRSVDSVEDAQHAEALVESGRKRG